MEGNETAKGWPLGLGNMTARIRVAAPPQPPLASRIFPSTISFTSFSSSNLDTESTASFFPDPSVPLGRLIGIRASGKVDPPEQPRETTSGRCRAGLRKGHENSQGHCAPLLHHVIRKIGRSGTTSNDCDD
ncbi:uncharacterized protein LOC105167887 [Sesamum indicum]|uniref:Uncharacterized protein LOC105167887 n=1 Tax=Sesamum indicum TaxID=4182 RepID=A0A6I9TNC6_SESIN|nr:uncharacterized protein LOC105167887 [Sesamum indicum]